MLLECQHCGAPLDVSKDERLTRCKYCGTISRAKALRTVADETPPDFRPPPQWTPPPHAHADPAKVLKYHASWAIGRLIRTVVAIVVLMAFLPLVVPLIIGFVMATVGTTSDVRSTINAAQSAIELARRQMKTMEGQINAGGVSGGSLLTNDGAPGLAEQYRARLGGKVKALRLVIHPTHAALDAQDPKVSANVDRYAFRNGTVSDPEPVNVQHLGRQLERQLFDLDDVALDRMSALGQTALAELPSEGAAVSHVIVERPAGGKVVVRVYVTGPRGGGRVEFSAQGSKTRVYK